MRFEKNRAGMVPIYILHRLQNADLVLSTVFHSF
jgi:hypothetical protein